MLEGSHPVLRKGWGTRFSCSCSKSGSGSIQVSTKVVVTDNPALREPPSPPSRQYEAKPMYSVGILLRCTIFMSSSTKSALKSLLRGVAWLLFMIAGLAFWVGGRAIHEFAKTERMLAEMVGIGLAVVCGGLGAVAKAYGEPVAEAEENGTSTSEGKSVRKFDRDNGAGYGN